jgi:uncharacterized protein (DUF2141 family)
MTRVFFSLVAITFIAILWFGINRGSNSSESTPVNSATKFARQSQTANGLDPDLKRRRNPLAAKLRVSEYEIGQLTAGNADSGSLTVCVSGLRPQGEVLLAVFENADGFPDRDNATRSLSAPVTDNAVELTVDNLQTGNYAVAIFQDLNEDGVLNKGAFGVPSEPYGFSNNVRGSFGPPSFDAASFALAQRSKQVNVTVK